MRQQNTGSSIVTTAMTPQQWKNKTYQSTGSNNDCYNNSKSTAMVSAQSAVRQQRQPWQKQAVGCSIDKVEAIKNK